MCYANRHTFMWGSSTAFDAMPLSLRCECGAMSREDTNPVQRLQAENERLATELAALSRELEAARECHVEKLERAVKAEAVIVDLHERLIATKDELAFQAKNAADAQSERAYQSRRAADALEALSEIVDLLKPHDDCGKSCAAPKRLTIEALAIARKALGSE